LQLFAKAGELALVTLHGSEGDVFEDGLAAQLAADFGRDNQGVGLAFADAKFGDVGLHVVLVVVGVLFIVEATAARRFQVVDPGQIVGVDEISVEAKSND